MINKFTLKALNKLSHAHNVEYMSKLLQIVAGTAYEGFLADIFTE